VDENIDSGVAMGGADHKHLHGYRVYTSISRGFIDRERLGSTEQLIGMFMKSAARKYIGTLFVLLCFAILNAALASLILHSALSGALFLFSCITALLPVIVLIYLVSVVYRWRTRIQHQRTRVATLNHSARNALQAIYLSAQISCDRRRITDLEEAVRKIDDALRDVSVTLG
jgi:uncharacterized membrane protein